MLDCVHRQPCLLDPSGNWLLGAELERIGTITPTQMLSAHYEHKCTHRSWLHYTGGGAGQQPHTTPTTGNSQEGEVSGRGAGQGS